MKSSTILILAVALVVIAAIAAIAYVESRPKRTLLDQLGGAGGIVTAVGAFL